MGIPQSAKNNWNSWRQKVKKKKTSSIFKKVWFIATLLQATVDLSSGLDQHRIKSHFLFHLTQICCHEIPMNDVMQIYPLFIWTAHQDREKARADRLGKAL